MTFSAVTLPAVARRYVLTGPAGPQVDQLVAQLIGAGAAVETIAPGTRYRLDGPEGLLDALAGELAPFEGYGVVLELPPVDVIRIGSTLAPAQPYRRSVTVHGTGTAHSYVARALDNGLAVATVGINRWSITGRTAALVAWLAAVWNKTPDEVLAIEHWTPESVAAEDAPLPVSVDLPPIQVDVNLPVRQTTSSITRDGAGDIRTILQLEQTVERQP